jgi:hypothetical protein
VACKNYQECYNRVWDWFLNGSYRRGPDYPEDTKEPCPECPIANRNGQQKIIRDIGKATLEISRELKEGKDNENRQT